jgi:hypothetical protein
MRIEVSVPGIRKDRGKLPAPTTLEPLRLASLLAAGAPVWGEMVDPPSEPVTGGEVRRPGGTGCVQPVSSANAPASLIRAAVLPLLGILGTDTNLAGINSAD